MKNKKFPYMVNHINSIEYYAPRFKGWSKYGEYAESLWVFGVERT